MIDITKKKFDRIIKKLENCIDNNINEMPPDLVQDLKNHKFWDFWSQNVRLNYYPNNYNIKIARERSLPTFIKHFKNELIC